MRLEANGQLAASSTAIYTANLATSGPGGAAAQCVGVVLHNTSASLTETVSLTLTISGGTARTIARAVLAPRETASVNGIVMAGTDVLKGATTTATTVDYVVTSGDAERPFSIAALDANGQAKQIATPASVANVTVGASTAAAGSSHSDAGALPAGTATLYPTTAADDTAGVKINAADQVTGRLVIVGNGVSNKILKVYGPTGATINGAAANAGFSSVSGKGVIAVCLNGAANTWLMA